MSDEELLTFAEEIEEGGVVFKVGAVGVDFNCCNGLIKGIFGR